MKKRIEVSLEADEIKFIKWMAKRDKVSFQTELQMIFYTELRQCKDLYMEEMEGEENEVYSVPFLWKLG